MFKKIIASVCALIIFFGGILSTSFYSQASGSLSPYSKIRMDRPSTSDHAGYVEVCVKNGLNYEVYVYFWYGDKLDNDLQTDDFRVNININFSSISFSPYSLNNTQMTLMIITSIDPTAGSGVLSQSGGSYTHDIGKQVVGYHVYGNFGTVTTYSGFVNNGFEVSYMDDDETVFHLIQLYNQLLQANANDEVIKSRLESIMNSTNSADWKLSQLIELQKETNTWLEKIFNFLEEKDEKDKEAATQQGNQSTADIDDMIQDDSAGFVDSLGGLTSSMSYTGTNCSWTFPTVKLPAISGVMDEVTLVESQEIDFSYWVNSIPSGILLLVQSVCTVALIVFCFKELYGAISYALTLKGGGNSE